MTDNGLRFLALGIAFGLSIGGALVMLGLAHIANAIRQRRSEYIVVNYSKEILP